MLTIFFLLHEYVFNKAVNYVIILLAVCKRSNTILYILVLVAVVLHTYLNSCYDFTETVN